MTPRTREAGGIGLGLAIAREITHRHGGMLSAHGRPAGVFVLSIRPLDEKGASRYDWIVQPTEFTWRETDPAHPALDVMVRLIGLDDE
jgi:signal transduction histidine kinase